MEISFKKSIKKPFENLGMPLSKYIITFCIPLLFFGLFSLIFFPILFYELMIYPLFGFVIYLLPLLCFILPVVYPIIIWSKKKREIDRNMCLFITRMGTLSTTNLSRKELIAIIAKTPAYESLSDEMKRLSSLMEYWNYTLPEAARYIANTTPSTMFADFLERMAHALDAGEDFKIFLEKEQKVVMAEYAANYRRTLKNLSIIQDVFVSVGVAAAFFIVFSYFMPIFAEIDVPLMLSAGVILFIIGELSVLYYLKTTLPKDDLWHSLPRKPKLYFTLKKIAIPISICCIILSIISAYFNLDFLLIASISLAPILIPSFLVKNTESIVDRCDETYDSFLRSVGSTIETVGGTLEASLARLQRHDFGPLTEHIQKLYRRLVTKIDRIKAWEYFSADTGSNLITKFTDMYVEAVSLGGKPDLVGRVVSTNFVESVILRKERYQHATAFNGILYGLTLSITFALSMGVSIMSEMNNLFAITPAVAGFPVPMLAATFDVGAARLSAGIMLVIHALICAYMMKVLSGRHTLTTMTHFVLLTWVSTGVYIGGEMSLTYLFAI